MRRPLVVPGLLLASLLALPAPVFAAAPVPDSQGVQTTPGTPLPITLTGTADLAATSVSFDVTSGPAHGGLEVLTGPMTCVSGACSASVNYTPDTSPSAYRGGDTFDFTMTADAETSAGAGTVSIIVDTAPVTSGDPPVSGCPAHPNSTYEVNEDTLLTVVNGTCDVLTNDTDAETDPLTATLDTPGSGTPVVSPNGAFTYQPVANANSAGTDPTVVTDSFTYHANDGLLDSLPATVSIHVWPVNDAPSFTPGSLTVTRNEDSGAYAAAWASAISAGPADESGQTVTFTAVAADPTMFSAGPAVSGTTGNLSFTPALNRNGTTNVTITAHDTGGTARGGSDASGSVIVAVTISPVNDPPVADDETASIAEDAGPTDILVLVGDTDVDFDTLSVTAVTTPAHGTASTNGAKATYTPNAGYVGGDSFDYTVSDGALTDTGTVTITVGAVNDAPSFTMPASTSANEDSGANSVSAFATSISPGPIDEAGQAVTFTLQVTANATLFSVAPAMSPTGTLTFTPAANRFGSATVSVTLMDDGGTAGGGNDTSTPQTLTITIDPVNDPPNALNDTGLSVAEGDPATALNVLGNDTSAPDAAEALVITAVTQPAHGTVVITGGGTGLTYQPAFRYEGTDVFSYTIQDPGSLTDTASAQITVTHDATAPVVVAPTESIRAGVTMGTTTSPHRISWSGSDPGSGIVRYDVERSYDGGAYVAIALTSLTSTFADLALNVGHTYQFRVRATDFEGNVSAYQTGPALHVRRYQETSTAIVYTSTWTRIYGTSYSGSYERYTKVALASATFTIATRDIALVSTKGPGRGVLRIYLDGVLIWSPSMYRSTTAYRQVIWSRHFAVSGTHVLRIVAATNTRIDLDGFLSDW